MSSADNDNNSNKQLLMTQPQSRGPGVNRAYKVYWPGLGPGPGPELDNSVKLISVQFLNLSFHIRHTSPLPVSRESPVAAVVQCLQCLQTTNTKCPELLHSAVSALQSWRRQRTSIPNYLSDNLNPLQSSGLIFSTRRLWLLNASLWEREVSSDTADTRAVVYHQNNK